VNESLAYYKRPGHPVFVMEIPRIPVEKVLRRQVRWYVAINVQAAPGLHGSDNLIFVDSGDPGGAVFGSQAGGSHGRWLRRL